MKSFLIINFYLKLFTILLQQQQKKKKTFHFDKLAYRRIDLNIVSAWLFVESLNSEQIAVIPSGGAPTVRSFTIANSEPAIAPRLPSQCSGFESNLRGFYISLFIKSEISNFSFENFLTFPTYRTPSPISRTLLFDTIHWQLIGAVHMIRCCCLVIRKYSTPEWFLFNLNV